MDITDILKPKSREQIDDIINEHISEFEETHLPNKFKWRRGQREAVQQIIQTYLENKYSIVILDAPVGSGKSLIAMAISFILNKIKKKGYVLASDISLQDQYENDIREYYLTWGSVKGVDNYMCIDNLEKHSLGTCKIRNITPKKMSCYNSCPYFSARDYAAEAETAVLNYNYWLIMQNSKDGSFFPKRDFTICDEAHKVLDIVQNHYSPRFNKNTIEKLKRLSEFFDNHKVRNHYSDVNNIESNIEQMWKTENQDILHECLCNIQKYLKIILKSTEILKDIVDKQYKDKKPPKEWMEVLYISDWVKDLHCKVEDYNYIINETTVRNLVKNPTVDELLFNCLEEGFLMNRYFHRFTGFTVLMSATFSDPIQYMKNMSIKGAKYIKMENLFPFERSPIYYFPKRKMSYNHIENNKIWLYDKINNIIEKHKGEKGIIHSASYDLTFKIRENLTPNNRKRVFTYDGTQEKRKVLDMMKIGRGKILMGPSLTHGLDLFNDLCRFIIFAKIPYPNLKDKFVSAKTQKNPEWYQWKTSIEVMQGLGRGIRNENDWCITYILDGSLSNLINNSRKNFPDEFYKRIIIK